MTSEPRKLNDATYLAFPFRVGPDEPETAKNRGDHVKHQIEQVLFTDPTERIFRPEFGAGVRRLVFEPNSSSLWKSTEKRLLASLADALAGEVDPKTLQVSVGRDPQGDGETLAIHISYRLATVDRLVEQQFKIGGGSDG